MKTWKLNETIDTLKILDEHCGKPVPVYMQIRLNGVDLIFPIVSIGTNSKSVLISANIEDSVAKKKIKSLNDKLGFVERVRK